MSIRAKRFLVASSGVYGQPRMEPRLRARGGEGTRLHWSGFIAALLIAQGSIYWLPGINAGLWAVVKDGVLAVFLFGWAARRCATHSRMLDYVRVAPEGRLVVALVLSTFVGVVGSPAPVDSLLTWSRFLGALLLACATFDVLRERPYLLQHFDLVAAAPVLAVSCYIVGAKLGILPAFRPPSNFAWGPEVWEPYTIGLSYRRNAMSGAIAYAWPVCFFRLLLPTRGNRSFWHTAWLLFCLLVLAGAAVITSGRGGLFNIAVISLLGVTHALRSGATRGVALFVVLAALVIVTLGKLGGPLKEQQDLLLRNANQSQGGLDWNRLSSGRLTLYQVAVNSLWERPLTGGGLGQVSIQTDKGSLRAHNLYLSLAMEAGLLAALCAAAFAAVTVTRWTRYMYLSNPTADPRLYVWTSMLLGGILQTFYEGGSIFGGVHNAMPFWFALAALQIMQSRPPLTTESKARPCGARLTARYSRA